MRYSNTQVIVLYISTTPFKMEKVGSGWSENYYFYGIGAGTSITYYCNFIDGDTEFIRKEDLDDSYDDEGRANDSYLVYNKYDPKWTNYDLYNIDDTLFLPASYPIDAETGEEIHDYEIGGEPDPEPTPEPDTPSAFNIRAYNHPINSIIVGRKEKN